MLIIIQKDNTVTQNPLRVIKYIYYLACVEINNTSQVTRTLQNGQIIICNEDGQSTNGTLFNL